MKKKVGIIALATCLLLVGCGGETPSTTSGRPQGTKIVIYAGGSSEFVWTEGSKEAEVIEAIEQKYYDDTGVSLDFSVGYLGKTMKDKLSSDLQGNNQVDIAISHTGGGDGIDDWVYENEQFYDLSDIIEDYGENIVDYSIYNDGENSYDAFKRMTDETGAVVGIPSVVNPYKFGILVRKDWMREEGYTDNPAEVSATMKLVDNFETFREMALKFKERENTASYAISGSIWDLEKAGILGAYGLDAGFFSMCETESGDVMHGYAQAEYKQILDVEYDYVMNGILSKESQTIYLDAAERAFASGQTGIFIQDPTVTHLIKVARKAKAANPSAEFTMLGALTKDGTSTEKGFMRNSVATFAACVLKKSNNAEKIVRFVNWMYSDVDNYLLCKYGVEGVHWVNNGDGTYSYANEEDYTNPPYSGVLSLVENQNIADLTFSEYTAEERGWIELAQNKDNYLKNPVVDYLMVLSNRILNEQQGNAARPLYTLCNGVWVGGNDVNEFEAGRQTYVSATTEYTQKITELYKNMTGVK